MLQELVGRPGDDKVIGEADEIDLGADLFVPVPDVAWKRRPQARFEAVQGHIGDDGGADGALRRPCLRWVEDVPFHVPRLQPLTQNALVHRDMRQEPLVTDFVKTRADIAF